MPRVLLMCTRAQVGPPDDLQFMVKVPMAASSFTGMSTTSYAGSREPTQDEWAALHNLEDILDWAKIKGSVDYPPSQRGSLLAALGAEPDTTVEEFAAIPEDACIETIHSVWEYGASCSPDDGLDTDTNIKPTPMVKGRAVSAHYVARI